MILRKEGIAKPKVQGSPANTFARFDSEIWDQRRTAYRGSVGEASESEAPTKARMTA